MPLCNITKIKCLFTYKLIYQSTTVGRINRYVIHYGQEAEY